MPVSGDHVRAFAVVRLDLAQLGIEPELSVKVVEVLPDEDSAAAEVRRLNEINEPNGSKYFIQATRWYPHGR